MMRQDVLVGSVTAALCLLLLIKHRWFLENSRHGRRLVRWFGPQPAVWVLRVLVVSGIVFGCLLATGIVRPIQW